MFYGLSDALIQSDKHRIIKRVENYRMKRKKQNEKGSKNN